MNTILLILCNALSCFIISTILFQFMNGKYKKSSQSRYVYIVIETVTVIFTTCINMLNHSILNLVVWGVLTGIIAYALYYEDMDKPLRRIIECEAWQAAFGRLQHTALTWDSLIITFYRLSEKQT